MTRRQYLVALNTWSCHHAWIEAESEDAAEEAALELWAEDDSRFSYKDGGVDGTVILDTREVTP